MARLAEEMNIQTVGIVGYGAFGKFLRVLFERFAPAIHIRIYSSHKEPDDKTFFSLTDTAACDALILAVPIHAFEDTLKNVLPLIGKSTVIVDVATVKVHTVEILKRLSPDRKWIATHPMFGPESYEKKQQDISGFRIVIAEHTLEKSDVEALIQLLTSIGFNVVTMSADEHDKNLAETLFLTHFIGQIISRGGFERTDIDTPSFGYLMDAVDSVRHDTALFADVFKFNQYCKKLLDRFELSEKEVRTLLEK